ncbi:MAG: RnfABCDGE type electron transport complex subunit C [Clostridia bacterium]|nr:RnfABCDGE type electron transport complex subunit C [Clostridia bacterium]
MSKRYHGGIWLGLNKRPAIDRPVDELSAPARVVIPLLQHRGESAALCVKKGDRVQMGQPLGTDVKGISCAAHSSVSGAVYDITEIDHPIIGKSVAVVVQNDGNDAPFGYVPPERDAAKMSPDEIISRIKRVSIASACGPDYPLWARLRRMADFHIRTLVLNAVETEPYICNAQKLIEEDPEQIASGFYAMMKATGCVDALLAVSDDYGTETDDIRKAASLMGYELRLLRVPQKYPSGHEKFLFRVMTGEALRDGISPEEMETGFVYAEDCLGVYRAIRNGTPQITKVVTVAGSAVGNPQVFEIRIGTSIHDVLERCSLSFEPERVVLGSAMRGTAVDDLHTPVIKPVYALLALKSDGKRRQPARCINCGKCSKVCPQGLFPNFIALNAVNADFGACHELHIENCIECGSCSYICPGRMPIVELIKNMKKARVEE